MSRSEPVVDSPGAAGCLPPIAVRGGVARPEVVIVGGGFGGLYAARRSRRAPVRVTLVDRRNHHLFQPLLYQVATAGAQPGDIAAPIRSVLRRQKNARGRSWPRRRASTSRRKRLVLADGELAYDYPGPRHGRHPLLLRPRRVGALAPRA